jgi:hypothetical protein
MEVHQGAFLQAVALAGAVALGMTVWDNGREEALVQAAGTPVRKVETRKDQFRLGGFVAPQARIDNAIAPARKTRASGDPISR